MRYFGFCHPAAKIKRERIAFHTGRPLFIGAVPVPPVKPPHVITCPCCGDLRRFSQPRTRRRHLLALGADPGTVHMATRSRKGYWRMSQNEIVRFALNNYWLEEQGVPD